MKILIATMGLVMASTAFAQNWDTNDGKLTLIGCYGKQDGVYCDYNFVLTKKQTATVGWGRNDFKVYNQDGVSQIATSLAFADGKLGSSSSYKEIIANVPVKLQVYFNTPSSTGSFRGLTYDNVKFDNIPVRPYGSVTKTSTQLPSGPSVTGFSISLTNCQLQGQNYVCTAILTPNK